MTKQEKIEEILFYYIHPTYCDTCSSSGCNNCKDRWELVKEAVVELHNEGCVLKVDKELPDIFDSNENGISALAYKKKLAGYGAFEPLIKEG